MSVLTVLASNAALAFGGRWGTFTVGSKTAWAGTAQHSQVEFTAVGTDCSAQIFGGSAETLTITIDGVAGTPFTPPAAWTTTTVFSGLSDAAHTVKIKTSKTSSMFSFESANAFAVTGAAPSVALPDNYSTTINQGVASLTGIQTDNTPSSVATTSGYTNPITGQDMSIRFRAKCERILIWAVTGTSKVLFAIDGVDQATGGTTSTPTGGLWNWCVIATGLDPLVEHEYTVFIDSASASVTALVADLMLVGGTGLVASTPQAKSLWAFYGDSIWRGIGGTTNDCFKATPHDYCQSKLIALRQMGVSGTTVMDSTTGNEGELAARIAAIPSTSTGVIILYGLNDAAQAGGAETAGQFRTAYDNMLTQVRTRIGASKHVYCLGILNTTQVTAAANRTTFNTQISDSVTAQADAFTHYISTDGWITPGTDTSDGQHPTEAGYTKITTQLLAQTNILSGNVAGAAGMHYAMMLKRRNH